MRRRSDRIIAWLALIVGLIAALLLIVEVVFVILWLAG